FHFAASQYIEKSMQDLEKKFLKTYTPCKKSGDGLANTLGVVHVELIIIHPFREREMEGFHVYWQI
ncbi:MAG: hypothetical protein HYX60_02860, partial [Legionella longbeachae]|nr:hypothetical protein [Legionella longbeachae]